jgi:hypothetical protein
MREISKEKIDDFRKEVEKEFPESYGLQQVHLARLIIEEKTKGVSGRELVEYYRKMAERLDAAQR